MNPVRGGLLRLSLQASSRWWALHRAWVQRRLPPPPFLPAARSRWLFISEPDPISTTQVFPFFCYARQLRRLHGIGVREISAQQFMEHPPYEQGIDVVCFQTWFDWTTERMMQFVDRLKTVYPAARLVYLDWFAPTDLRYAEILENKVDVYVKKHVLRDRAGYGQTTAGDTNLTDYYSSRLNLNLAPVMHRVPTGFWNKLAVGTNFAISAHMLPLFAGAFPEGERPIDVHARLAVKGTPWYEGMRREAAGKVSELKGLKVVSEGRISRREYFDELFGSKICFSPFGYGEVCWRDYEAALSGALLVKPDMSHIETSPDIFVPFKTYVPVAWDLSDLQEKVGYYAAHSEERRAIAERAFAVIHSYIQHDGFLKQMKPVFDRLH
jgi:hypothetical protein